MAQTVFITGASSGIGEATAKLFHEKGWNVVATMRSPEDGAALDELDNVLVTRLDVTDAASITSAVGQAVEQFGTIDVLVNNAAYGAGGPLEAFSMERIRRQFETNVIGLIATTKAVVPLMRAQKSGTIVNISSTGGRITFPLSSIYQGTKFAVEGFSEALHYEMDAIGVKVKIVEPGAVATKFVSSVDFANDEELTEYQELIGKLWGSVEAMMGQASDPMTIAEVIHTAATDDSDQLRWAAGEDAVQVLAFRDEVDDATMFASIRAQFGL